MKIRKNNGKVMLKDIPVGECFRVDDEIAIKTDEIAEKIEAVFDRLIAEREKK